MSANADLSTMETYYKMKQFEDLITVQTYAYTGLEQTWEIWRVSMKTRRYVGKLEEQITTEYEKLVSLLCFVNEFPRTKRRKYSQYTSE